MEEIRINNLLEMELKDGSVIKGKVVQYTKDRVLVLVNKDCAEKCKTLKELDELYVVADTSYGVKEMFSGVLSVINSKNCIIIENNKAENVEQKRESVRAVDNFDFIINYEGKMYKATCKNISAGGIAFVCEKSDFKSGQIVELKFQESIFSKSINCNAQIIKAKEGFYTSKFENLGMYDENYIVKRVFKLLSKK